MLDFGLAAPNNNIRSEKGRNSLKELSETRKSGHILQPNGMPGGLDFLSFHNQIRILDFFRPP